MMALIPDILNPQSENVCQETSDGSSIQCIQDLRLSRESWTEQFLDQAKGLGWRVTRSSEYSGLFIDLIRGDLKMKVNFTRQGRRVVVVAAH
jgi:hypothetical protein